MPMIVLPWSRPRLHFSCIIIVLIILVILLELVHIIFISRLYSRNGFSFGTLEFGLHFAQSWIEGENVDMIFKKRLHVQRVHIAVNKMLRCMKSYRVDRSGTYRLLDTFVPSDQVSLFPAHDVTIVTQCSVNHLFRIPHLAVRWNGPISVAVFTHDDVFQLTVHTILHLHSCFQNIYNHVTFHLVLPVNRTPMKIENILRLEEMNVKCSKTVLDKNWMKWSKHNYDIYGLDFPQNVLRNLAINHVLTKYVLLLDVDMLPSARLSHQFSSMLHRMQSSSAGRLSVANFSKTAFVLPAFEVKMYVPTNFSFSSYFPNLVLPHTRQDLVKFWERAAARPFYIELCKKCQSPTDYHRWRYLSPEMELSVGYRVDWIDPWEPFYIAASSLPLYDERFKQYGFNRISQVCEMHVAGYTFAVLDNAFIIHLGFKSQGDFHTSKAVEQTVNRKLFRRFKEELKVKYSASRNRC